MISILHVCKPAIYSSFKKQELITNTKRFTPSNGPPGYRTKPFAENNRKFISMVLESHKDSEKWQGWGSPEETDGLASLWICSHVVCEATGNSESNHEAERPRS